MELDRVDDEFLYYSRPSEPASQAMKRCVQRYPSFPRPDSERVHRRLHCAPAIVGEL
jgi:hypothetical protein